MQSTVEIGFFVFLIFILCNIVKFTFFFPLFFLTIVWSFKGKNQLLTEIRYEAVY